MAWIDAVLDRFVNLFNWRIANKQLLGLSDEWGRKFGKWRVTQEIADRAVDMCQAQWERVPINVTREFEKILNCAMAQNNKIDSLARENFSEGDLYFKYFDQVAKIIRDKNPELTGIAGGMEIGQIINSMINHVKAEHPKLITGVHSIPVIKQVLLNAHTLAFKPSQQVQASRVAGGG